MLYTREKALSRFDYARGTFSHLEIAPKDEPVLWRSTIVFLRSWLISFDFPMMSSEEAPSLKMRFMLLFSRQGKLRLQKWYTATAERDKKKMVRELMQVVLARKPKMSSFLEWRDLKIVYKRYASLYFCCAVEEQDNELITLEVIHRFVELLDKYFGSVCELDIIFNFEKAYFILDEFLIGGEIQDTSKKSVLKAIEQADLLQEEDESPRSVLEEMGLA
ncbi:AP-1 complex subunit sigma-1A isoform X1 [Salmo salar]|uniref:AP-1 complex subunit sigma-1A isoform X1 n=6 Tax=Salmoninae TaxID=504568 RepID=A0A1S3N8P8_SALSA|nr:AP-1 complex subunit sigma-1A isoform X1 [Salmo salar]|eukprot:XP_014011804.1 PREDICTED: AP-1 complex subunit sigma-1A-like isoform X1 [Salmo salar]